MERIACPSPCGFRWKRPLWRPKPERTHLRRATSAAYFTTLNSLRGDALDSKRVVERFEAGLPSMSFPFASVAEDFRLIEEDTRSVLIPNGRGRELAERLRQGERSRALLRAAGDFV